MQAELEGIAFALSDVRDMFAVMLQDVSQSTLDDRIVDAVARAIFHELEPVARHIAGSDFEYALKALSGTSMASLRHEMADA